MLIGPSTRPGSSSTAVDGRWTTARAVGRSCTILMRISSQSASWCTLITAIRICRRSTEFQRFKTHPAIAPVFEGGERVSYGARAIAEGGYQLVPKLVFPGGALLGCAAGFVNVPRIKGSHNAVLSGMLAADHVVAALKAGRANDELSGYEAAWRSSAIGRDLWAVRNVKPLWSKLGTVGGVAAGGLDMWTNTMGFSLFGTLSHGGPDHKATLPAADQGNIDYPKADRVLTFDRASSVFVANVQPSRRTSRSICR